ncbi:MAG: hypothetical protein JWN14_3236 [Chthonomonadales bacterium]|nr:hypothetical protein [Chthonomonadales bacterium]
MKCINVHSHFLPAYDISEIVVVQRWLSSVWLLAHRQLREFPVLLRMFPAVIGLIQRSNRWKKRACMSHRRSAFHRSMDVNTISTIVH